MDPNACLDRILRALARASSIAAGEYMDEVSPHMQTPFVRSQELAEELRYADEALEDIEKWLDHTGFAPAKWEV